MEIIISILFVLTSLSMSIKPAKDIYRIYKKDKKESTNLELKAQKIYQEVKERNYER